jgi:hypothetical protein
MRPGESDGYRSEAVPLQHSQQLLHSCLPGSGYGVKMTLANHLHVRQCALPTGVPAHPYEGLVSAASVDGVVLG